LTGVLVGGHYSLRMQLSSSVVHEGDSVTISCDVHVHSKLTTSPTFVFVKKLGDGGEVKIASNHFVEELFRQTRRYNVTPDETHRPRHVLYTLRISSMSFAHAKLSHRLSYLMQ